MKTALALLLSYYYCLTAKRCQQRLYAAVLTAARKRLIESLRSVFNVNLNIIKTGKYCQRVGPH